MKRNDEEFIARRDIELPNGDVLQLEMTRTFIDMLLLKFNITHDHEITDDMIRSAFTRLKLIK